MMNYQVKLDNFEGPIDLLLFFIQRDQLNIYDIPISYITSEFIKYLSIMEVLNIDIGGEFVHMASMLMKIKTKMLLPIDEEDELVEDPRTPLVQRLLEYKQFKDAGEKLAAKQNMHSDHYPKGANITFDKNMHTKVKYPENVNIFSLVEAFQNLISNLPELNKYEVHQEQISLDNQIVFITEKFKNRKELVFSSIISKFETRLQIVVTFVAILEMIRTKQIYVKQSQSFGKLVLIKNNEL